MVSVEARKQVHALRRRRAKRKIIDDNYIPKKKAYEKSHSTLNVAFTRAIEEDARGEVARSVACRFTGRGERRPRRRLMRSAHVCWQGAAVHGVGVA